MMMNNTLAQLRDLKLAGMASAVEEQLSSSASTDLTFEERLALMVDREVHQRDDKRRAALLKKAGLKYPQACIEDVDSRAGRGFERGTLMSLALSRWVDDGAAILLCGATGSGKSWLACALAQYACRRGHSALYLRVPRLAEDLRVLHGNGGFGRWLATVARTDVLLLDDWGLAALDGPTRADLMEVIDDRAGSRPTNRDQPVWLCWSSPALGQTYLFEIFLAAKDGARPPSQASALPSPGAMAVFASLRGRLGLGAQNRKLHQIHRRCRRCVPQIVLHDPDRRRHASFSLRPGASVPQPMRARLPELLRVEAFQVVRRLREEGLNRLVQAWGRPRRRPIKIGVEACQDMDAIGARGPDLSIESVPRQFLAEFVDQPGRHRNLPAASALADDGQQPVGRLRCIGGVPFRWLQVFALRVRDLGQAQPGRVEPAHGAS